jgi:predicted lipoprotein with Yx(FWY)xxD motif
MLLNHHHRLSSSSIRRSARAIAGAVLLAASLTTGAFASSSVTVAPNPQSGNILVDDHGMTLYRYTPDQPNSSTCYDGCARAWPPVLVDSVPTVQDATLAAGLGIAPRTDGTRQLTFQGAPLYLYVGDTQPGDTTGEASDGVWFVVNVPSAA